MVRRIRDDLARELAGKSSAEIIDFFNQAGEAARARATLISVPSAVLAHE